MPILRDPVDSTAQYAIQLEILQKIESLGGFAGYEKNPDAFTELVSALDTFDSELWTKSIKELAEREKDPNAQALKARLQAELDLQNSDPKLAQKQRVSNIVKGIEILGGSVGFKTFTQNPQTASSVAGVQKIAAATDEWSTCYAWGFVASAWFITTVTLYADGHDGSGYAWGPALGVGNLEGALTYKSFDADGFSFQNIAAVATAWITKDGNLTSQFTGGLIGVSVSLSFGGTFHW